MGRATSVAELTAASRAWPGWRGSDRLADAGRSLVEVGVLAKWAFLNRGR
jgi:hypothetical protein